LPETNTNFVLVRLLINLRSSNKSGRQHASPINPNLRLGILPFLLFLAACAPSQPTAASPATLANSPTVAPGEASVTPTLEPTATATLELANLVIGPQTLGQVRLRWSIAGPTDNNPTIDCRPTKQICNLRTNIGGFAFSPDGSLLAVGTCLGIRIWEQTVSDLEDHRCTAESAIMLYDSATGEERARFAAATIPLSLAFNPDGAVLAAGLANNNIELWDLASGELTATLETGGKYFGVPSLAFTPDGRLLISASEGQMQIWDWGSARRLERILATYGVGGISPDSRKLTLLHYDSTGTPDGIRVYDIDEPHNFSEIPTGLTNASLFYFNPDNGWLVFIGSDGERLVARFWDPASETTVGALDYHRDFEQIGVSYGLDNGGFTPDGYFLITRRGYLVNPERQPDTPLSQLPQACGFALFDVEANQIFHLPEMGNYDVEYQGQVFAVTKCDSPEYMYSMGLINDLHVPRILSPDGRFIAGQDVEGSFYVWGVDPSQPAIAPECFGDC